MKTCFTPSAEAEEAAEMLLDRLASSRNGQELALTLSTRACGESLAIAGIDFFDSQEVQLEATDTATAIVDHVEHEVKKFLASLSAALGEETERKIYHALGYEFPE